MDNRDARIRIHATMFPCNRSTAESVGYDIRCATGFSIKQGEIVVVDTGVFLEMPACTYAMVCSRSGLASKGIFVANAPGIIDPDYKDEIKVILFKGTAEPATTHFKAGDRIAQLVFAKTLLGTDIAAGERKGGLGSTGE